MRSLPSVRAVQAARMLCLFSSKPRRSFVIQLRAGTLYVPAAPPTVIMFKSYWLAVVLAGVSVMTDAQSTVDDYDTASCAGAAGLLDVVSAVETLASTQQLITSQVSDGISGVMDMIASECEKANETALVNEIRDVKRLLESGNETRLEDVVEEMKGEIADEITDVKRRIASGCEEANETRLAEIEKAVKEIKAEMKEEISGVKTETNRVLQVLENVVNAMKTIASNQQKTADELSQVKRLLASNQSACECVNSTCPSPAAPVVVVNSTDCIPMSTTASPPESSSRQALVSALVCEYQRLQSVIKISKRRYYLAAHRRVVNVLLSRLIAPF